MLAIHDHHDLRRNHRKISFMTADANDSKCGLFFQKNQKIFKNHIDKSQAL
jgi:hypothetical protein